MDPANWPNAFTQHKGSNSRIALICGSCGENSSQYIWKIFAALPSHSAISAAANAAIIL
jgi:hypothetical protein